MSDIFFECSNCEQPLIVDEEGRGQKIECPECAHDVVIPEDAPLVDLDDGSEGDVAADDQHSAGDDQPTDGGISDEDVAEQIENVRFGCPSCQQLLEVGVDALGMQLDCPSCGGAMMAPSRADVMEANLTEIVAGEEMDVADQELGFGYLPPRRDPVEDSPVASGTAGPVQPTLRRSEWRPEDQLKERMAPSTPVGNLPQKKRPVDDDAAPSAQVPAAENQTAPADEPAPVTAPVVKTVDVGDEASGGRTVRVHPMRRGADEDDEMERMRGAMDGGDDGLEVKRVAGTETMVVRCPDCRQRYVLNFRMAGSEYVCRGCHVTMMLPRPDVGKAATVVGKTGASGNSAARHAHRQRVALPSRRGAVASGDTGGASGPMGGRPSAMLEGGRIPTPSEMEAWGDGVPGVTKPRDFRGAFVVVTVLVLLGGLITWGIIRFSSVQNAADEARYERARGGEATPMTGAAVLEAELQRMRGEGRKRTSEEARVLSNLIEEKVRGVLSASDMPMMLMHCDRPEQVAGRMKQFYSRGGGYSSFTSRFGPVETVLLARRMESADSEYQMTLVTFEGRPGEVLDLPILEVAVRIDEGGLKVDWDHLEKFSDMSLEELGRVRPTEAQTVRVNVDLNANYYNFGFTEESWGALYLFDPTPGVEATLPVYVKRNTDAYSQIDKLVRGLAGSIDLAKSTSLPMTLSIRYEETDDYRGFVVDEVISTNWLRP